MILRDGKGHSLVHMLCRAHRGNTVACCWNKGDAAFVGGSTFRASLLDATDGVSSFECLMKEMSGALKVSHLQPGSR